jgi:hypothetical protein
LDQLIQLAISVYYNRDITNREKDKKHDLIAASTRLGPASRVCYRFGQEGHFHKECKKGGQPGRQPHPQLGPCPLCKGNHWRSKCPASRWKTRCHLLWIYGSQPPVHAPLLGIHVEEPQGSHNGKEAKIIFLLDSGSCFSILFSPWVPGSMTIVIIQGKSGKPLEPYFTRPLLCFWGDLSSVTLSS